MPRTSLFLKLPFLTICQLNGICDGANLKNIHSTLKANAEQMIQIGSYEVAFLIDCSYEETALAVLPVILGCTEYFKKKKNKQNLDSLV